LDQLVYASPVVQPDVTAADVLTTMEEFDRLGRAEFLTKYGYGESRSYFLNHGGRFYDSKAIVGVAHQLLRWRRHRGDATAKVGLRGVRP
jgi:hypothetical protein